MLYKTRGIILKRSNLGEADRIVTILTEKYGKVRVVAKGVRKTLSKMAGHLEPFCLTRLQMVEGRNLDIITSAEVEECFYGLRSDLGKTNACFYMAEVIDKMVEEGEPHLEIFDLLCSALRHADLLVEPLLISYFEINFLSEMGFSPELYHCTKCREAVTPTKNNFDFGLGGLVCEACGTYGVDNVDNIAGASSLSSDRPVMAASADRAISDEAIKLIRLCLKHRFQDIQKIKITPALTREIKSLTSHYLKHIHQKDFKTAKYLV